MVSNNTSIVDIKQHIKNGKLAVKAVPNAKSQRIIEENGIVKVYLASPADKNKANKELITLFKKKFKLKVEIKSGLKSRNKILLISGDF